MDNPLTPKRIFITLQGLTVAGWVYTAYDPVQQPICIDFDGNSCQVELENLDTSAMAVVLNQVR